MKSAVRAAVIVPLACLAAACKSDPPAKTVHLSGADTASSAINAAMAAAFPNTPSVANILGYNDAQALQKNGNATDYGPEVRVYVAPKTYAQGDYTAPGGALVALLEVDGSADAIPATYTALKLDQSDTTRIYCVYLTLSINGSNRNWDGFVVPVTATGCPGPDQSRKLNADEMTSAYNGQDDYPWVARFTDTDHDMPTIGVTCMTAWCEIGRGPNNGPSNPVNPNPPPNQTSLKPWFDEQRVAIGNPGNLQRDVRAEVMPVYKLADTTQADFAKTNGAKAATVFLGAAPVAGSKYANWGLQQNGNDVYIRKFAQDDWRAEFVPAGGTPTGAWPWRVIRTDHSGPGQPDVPGIARWVWNPNDEEIWLGCDQGCCVVSGQPITVGNRGGGPPGPPPGTKRP